MCIYMYIYIYIHIYTTECYSAIKKDKSLPFVATWMDLEDIMLREISWRKTKTERLYNYISLIYRI